MTTPAWVDFRQYFKLIIDNQNAMDAIDVILHYYNINPNDARYWTSQIGQEKIGRRVGCTRQTIKTQLDRVATELVFPCPFCPEEQTGILDITDRNPGKSYSIKPLITWLEHLQDHYDDLTEDEFIYYLDKFMAKYKPEPTEAQIEARRQNITNWHLEQGHNMRQPNNPKPKFGPVEDGDF